jgi:GntR family transcriptional repressor for pyruvate dehydrogenase complex
MITRITKNNVSDETYDQLLSAIVRKDYLPGSKLPSENELSDLLNVSRNTVRQAVQKLNVLGLTETRTGKGTYVKQVDVSIYMNFILPLVFLGDHDYLMLMEFRKGIEIECAKLAAERATDEDIKKLEDLMECLSENTNDVSVYSGIDIDFHVALAKFSKNEMFEKVMNMVKYLLSVKFEEYIRKFGNESSIKHHYEILQAIKEHNPENAAKYMDQHLTNIIDMKKKDIAK